VALIYNDRTSPPGEGEHASPGCCERAAIAGWRLGEQPPVAQSLSPKLGVEAGYRNPPSLPSIALGRSSVTAIWTVGGAGEKEHPGEAKLEEAFGQVGRPLHIATLMTAPEGIPYYTLTTTRGGDPIAGWVDDTNKIRIVTGEPNGALRHSRRAQDVHGLVEPDQPTYALTGDGFTTHADGQIVFSYLSGTSEVVTEGPRKLLMIVSKNGQPFGSARVVTVVPPESQSSVVLAGGDGSVLGLWEWWNPQFDNFTRASLGGLASPFAKPVAVGEDPVGFVGGRGEAVVVYRARLPGYSPEGLFNFRLDVVTARPGHSFGKPRPLAPKLPGCGLDTDGEGEQQPIATSSNGYAILYLTCEDGSQYIIRYKR
jgi:hypothetical protein